MSMPEEMEKYQRHVNHLDMSGNQKNELLHTVWRMMENFVDRAFGIDSVQQRGTCSPAKDAGSAETMVSLKPIITTPYRLADAFRATAGTRRGRKT